MIKNLICIECPKSCVLTLDIENCRVVKVSGNQCPKGEDYGKAEIENPLRILTATVLCQGLSLKMAPVRTDKPIPKAKIQEAVSEIRKMRIGRAVQSGDILARDFLGLGVNLIATRECG
jgi:CxxC motif-containing protein